MLDGLLADLHSAQVYKGTIVRKDSNYQVISQTGSRIGNADSHVESGG
jgi:hypothetical protein